MAEIQTEIFSWIKSLKGWQTELAYKILSHQEISDLNYSEIIQMLKNDTPFVDKVFPNIGQVVGGGNIPIRLKSIGQISNIEGLAPRNPLELHRDDHNLIVVYGDNGSGKSGYTRIIKKICGKSGAKDLLPNIFGSSSDDGKCEITYLHEENEQTCIWERNGLPIEALQQVDIFDSDIGKTYIQSANKAAYTPAVISFFEALSAGYDEIKRRLSVERDGHVKRLPIIPNTYLGTQAAQLYAGLTSRHTEPNLTLLFPWTENDETVLKNITERLSAVDPLKAADAKRKNKKEVDDIVLQVKKDSESISSEAYAKLKELKTDAESKRRIANEAAEVLSGNTIIDGIGTESWKALWLAAKEYSLQEAYKGIVFPNTADGAKCVLCHQELNDVTRSRFKSLNEFIDGKVEKEATEAEQLHNTKIQSLPYILDRDTMVTKCSAAGLDDNWLTMLMNLNYTIVQNAKQMVANSDDLLDLSESIRNTISALETRSKQYEEEASKFEEDAKSFNRDQAERDRLGLESKKWCSQQKDAILTEVGRLQSIDQYNEWISSISTHAVTSKAGSISQRVVTDEYVGRFNSELQKFGAYNIKIELVKNSGNRGHVTHSLKISGTNAKPYEILSEGEFRIVALASFIADVTGGNNCNPFIFDDPISSLDQTYEEHTVNRLVELSRDRQVIVFTHRLSLLGLLSERCENDKVKMITLGIRREHWGTGEISDTQLFAKRPDKALNSLKDHRLPTARKILESNGRETYDIYASAICKEIRILIERIIELTLLADVIQRHRRAVKTQGKIQNLAKIEKSDCDFIEEYMTKYSKYEHSQSAESPVQLPAPDEIKTDIENIVAWLDGFSKRETPSKVNANC